MASFKTKFVTNTGNTVQHIRSEAFRHITALASSEGMLTIEGITASVKPCVTVEIPPGVYEGLGNAGGLWRNKAFKLVQGFPEGSMLQKQGENYICPQCGDVVGTAAQLGRHIVFKCKIRPAVAAPAVVEEPLVTTEPSEPETASETQATASVDATPVVDKPVEAIPEPVAAPVVENPAPEPVVVQPAPESPSGA